MSRGIHSGDVWNWMKIYSYTEGMGEIINLNRNPNGPPRTIYVHSSVVLREGTNGNHTVKYYIEGKHPHLGAVSNRGWQPWETIMLISYFTVDGEAYQKILHVPDLDAIDAEIEAGIRKPFR